MIDDRIEARFGKLAKQLDIELESSVLQRVFREIDEDNTGSVSVQELQKALQFHIVGYVFVEIARQLQAQGGIVEAFERLEPPEIVVGLLPKELVEGPRVPAPPLPRGEEGVSEKKFLRVLRQLKVARRGLFFKAIGSERAVFKAFQCLSRVFKGLQRLFEA